MNVTIPRKNPFAHNQNGMIASVRQKNCFVRQ